MHLKFSIAKIRKFVNQERVYMLMLSFILLFNALLIFSQESCALKEGFLGKRISRQRSPAKETASEFNPKAYEDISWPNVLENQGYIIALINIFGLGVLVVFSLGLFLDIRILMAKFRKKKIIKAGRGHLRVRWGIWDIFRLAIIFVFLGYILNIIIAYSSPAVPEGKSVLNALPLLSTGILDLVILGFIIYFVKIKYRHSLSAIGLKIKDIGKNIYVGILSYVAFLPLLTLLLLLLIWLAALLKYQPPQQAILKLFLHEKRIWVLVYSTLMVVLLGPVAEEVFFRGFSYNAIKRKLGKRPAILLTAVIFAGLHGTLFGFLPIMALGFLLAYVYEKTGSLIPAISIHILHNSAMISLLFLGRYFMNLVK